MRNLAACLCFLKLVAGECDYSKEVTLTATGEDDLKEQCKDPTLWAELSDLLQGNFEHVHTKVLVNGCLCITTASNSTNTITEEVDCVAACVSQTDRAANTMWAVSFMFINIVLAISVGIIFMAQSTPATTPPYNKFVFGILVFTVICTIISFIGMSKVDPGAVSASAVAFSVFTFLCSCIVAFGFFRSGPQVM
ncbi:Oidioi.mRNA.OKI2018_I69.PAR.g9832.t1.cds [Oikopleura dioica]|uniref:Oidioi.mRNA.OKI2018_I69.PAR.g9832.t1.cds n=1 Tax=Oikopleura dioica TaxID=34765 RepID=A0ABN7RSZ2_OIKDI|nr:Oidioi.mRNA.OKI2018_I69.PAR.g9832.t1.cds [Oikopleura dioica]